MIQYRPLTEVGGIEGKKMVLHRKFPYFLLCLAIFCLIVEVRLDADDASTLQTARQLVEEGDYGPALIVLDKILDNEAWLLFSTGSEFSGDLDREVISRDLRQAFEDNKISLSDKGTVSVEDGGSKWLIRADDKRPMYTIKRGRDGLNIYEAGNQMRAEAAAEAGEVSTLLGQFDEAVDYFQDATFFLEASNTPKGFRGKMEGVYAYRLANCYALAGKWDGAKTAFETFIERANGDFGEPKGTDSKLYSARRKVEWIDQRIVSRSKLTFRFTASLIAFLLTISLCLYIFAKDPLSYLNLSLSFFMFGFALWQLADAIRSYTLQPDTALI